MAEGGVKCISTDHQNFFHEKIVNSIKDKSDPREFFLSSCQDIFIS